MAMSNFSACLAFVLKYEGGKVDDHLDPGGRTNEGVTQRTYDAWRTFRNLPHQDVFLMVDTERDYIYRVNYWNKVNGNNLRLGEDLAVFDYAVNSGPGAALRAWNLAGSVDESADMIARRICTSRLSFLHRLRVWSRFGKGWTTRVNACQALALQMASKAVD